MERKRCISPKTLNLTFNEDKKNIIKECSSIKEFDKRLNEIIRSISDLTKISYKLGSSKNNKIKYKNKVISKDYINDVLKQIKQNIKDIPSLTNKIEHNKTTEAIKEKNTVNIELFKKEFFQRNVKGLESFLINLKKEIPVMNDYEKENFQNFLKSIIKKNIIRTFHRYENSKKVFHKRNFSLDKPFIISDEVVNFVRNENFGNSFYLFFKRCANTSDKTVKTHGDHNSPTKDSITPCTECFLNGKIKENRKKIISFYSQQIKNDPFLCSLNEAFLEELCDPNYFLFPILNLNYINFSIIISLLNIYFTVNGLRESKNLIRLDEPLQKLFTYTSYITLYDEQIEKEISPSSVVIPHDKRIIRTHLLKYFKRYVLTNKKIEINEESFKAIENYIFFVNKNIF